MSKQSEAKAAQGYRAEPMACCNCKHYESQFVEKKYEHVTGAVSTWSEEKGKKCGRGGFAVKKMAVCDLFVRKEAAQ